MDYQLPELGEGVEEGTISKILISKGDTVSEDQPLFELETAKAVLEVPSTISGTIGEIQVSEGDTIKVGDVAFSYEPAGEATDKEDDSQAENADESESTSAPKSTSEEKSTSSEVTTYHLPELGEGVEEGTISKVLIAKGDTVAQDDPLLELETAKAVLEVPSTISGTIAEVQVSEGDKLKVGDAVFTYQGEGGSSEESQPAAEAESQKSAPAPQESEPEATPKESPQSSQEVPPSAGGLVPAAPSSRRLARELGVDIRQVRGSGPAGRISKDDIKKHVKSAMQSGGGSAAAPAAPLPDFSKWGEVEAQELSGVRKATAQQMARSWMAPHVTQFDKADITELEAFRKKYSKKSDVKLTVTAVLLKASVSALQKFPQFNTSLDLAGNQLIYKKYFHIGVAVDTDRGLLVPVIRDVDQKGIMEIAAELDEVAGRARNRKTSLSEMQGGCFTLTNLGGIGGTQFTPIVNSPEAAILGVARGGMEPVWNGSEFEPRFMLPLALSYDHRIIDGADGARFLRYVCSALENPLLMAL